MIQVENLSMRGKLIAVLALPMLALTLFAGHAVWQEMREQAAMAKLSRAATLSLTIADLLVDLQTERSLSSVPLKRDEHAARTRLTQQRAASDRAWQRLDTAAPLLPARESGLNTSQIQAWRLDLARLRGEIDRAQLPRPRIVESYGVPIRALLGLLDGLAAYSADAEMTPRLTAYHGLIQAKEAAHMERLLGGQLLTGGADPNQRAHLIELASRQEILLDQFQARAPDAIRRAWREAEQSECARDIQQYRALLRRGEAGARASADAWLARAQCRIEGLRDVEAVFARHLEHIADGRTAANHQRLSVILILALLPIAPSLWLIMQVTRNVTGHSRWLLTAMDGIASGNFNVSLPPRSQDEFGKLARGLDALRAQIAQLINRQAQQLQREREMGLELERHSQAIQNFAQRVAAGDLAGRLENGDDTLGRLAGSLNHMAEGLAGLATQVRETGSSLLVTVNQMQSAVVAQSSGASEQAASLSETMTTLEQIRATSTQTLEKAQRLGEMAERARSEGEHGRRSVEESIAGISDVNLKVDAIARTILSLNERTQRIGDITGVVGGIARQLRLLSLNAAIEATRAGEAGQGFAVVATEVKQLAEQSQASTQQVQHILEEIRHATDRAVMATEDGAKGVLRGLELVQRAGEVIRGLEGVVRDTSLGSRQIVAAVRQESAGIEQIATAMSDIHAVTTRFVSATEQTRAASDELAHLAQRLSAVANLYRV